MHRDHMMGRPVKEKGRVYGQNLNVHEHEILDMIKNGNLKPGGKGWVSARNIPAIHPSRKGCP